MDSTGDSIPMWWDSGPSRRRSGPIISSVIPVPAAWGCPPGTSSPTGRRRRSEEHTSELQSRSDLVCRLLLEKKKKLPDEQDIEGDEDYLVRGDPRRIRSQDRERGSCRDE